MTELEEANATIAQLRAETEKQRWFWIELADGAQSQWYQLRGQVDALREQFDASEKARALADAMRVIAEHGREADRAALWCLQIMFQCEAIDVIDKVKDLRRRHDELELEVDGHPFEGGLRDRVKDLRTRLTKATEDNAWLATKTVEEHFAPLIARAEKAEAALALMREEKEKAELQLAKLMQAPNPWIVRASRLGARLEAANAERDEAHRQLNFIDGALSDAGVPVVDEDLSAAIEKLSAECRAANAGAAAMRDALDEYISACGNCDGKGQLSDGPCPDCRDSRLVLAADAGRAILAELTELRARDAAVRSKLGKLIAFIGQRVIHSLSEEARQRASAVLLSSTRCCDLCVIVAECRAVLASANPPPAPGDCPACGHANHDGNDGCPALGGAHGGYCCPCDGAQAGGERGS